MRSVITDLNNWDIADKGIGITFGLYVLDAYAGGSYTSVIPWDVVRKYQNINQLKKNKVINK